VKFGGFDVFPGSADAKYVGDRQRRSVSGAMIRERINAGLARARTRGLNKKGEPLRLGRPPVRTATERDIRKLRAEGLGILKSAKTLGIGTSVVQRVLAD
jgi:DNA invertase Pin-like site-specific DNA recombinase